MVNIVLKNMNGGISFSEQRRMDKEQWNNGRCPHCGREWELYQYDETLGRVYVCDNCEELINVITNVDDK